MTIGSGLFRAIPIGAVIGLLAACGGATSSAGSVEGRSVPAPAPAAPPLFAMDRTADANDPSLVWLANVVERRPALRVTPSSAEMDSLKRQGVRGAISLEYVVDTLGRVEPASIRVLSSQHPALVDAATAIARRMAYRPGRVRGKAVRVLMNTRMGIAIRGAR